MGNKRKWQGFVNANLELFRQLDIPGDCYETWERFSYFLMHGSYPGCHFALPPHSQMDAATHRVVSELVRAYFGAGYPDPGIVVLSAEETQQLKNSV